MSKYRLKTTYKKILADTVTPVSIYLRLRDKFPGSFLLESADSYRGSENNFTYICLNPIAGISVHDDIVRETFPDGSTCEKKVENLDGIPEALASFAAQFETEQLPEIDFICNGMFGHISYDAVQYFEDISLAADNTASVDIPQIQYQIFKYLIAINHFTGEMFLFEHQYVSDLAPPISSQLAYLERLIHNKDFPAYKFSCRGEEESNFEDEAFMQIVSKGIEHNHRGDVFQIVLSRRFSQEFSGDEFNVFRALRSINPSPYLFYFDYGSFKLFGSSPEAQLVVKKGKALVNPIAGTFKRTGREEEDAEAAEALKVDPKENAEHMMLVDLARNDLGKNCENVTVEELKEIRSYSHVIHMVSSVTGEIRDGLSSPQILADTFPAGTLSGAPKYRAMQLIDQYERGARCFYGGCVGFFGFNGEFNHAIVIRSFLSKSNHLLFQAGAGVVADSVPKRELQEVNNKVAALRSALKMAEEI